MAFDDYHRYDGLSLAELIRTGQVSAREVLEAALERADRLNPKLNAIIHRMDDAARATPVVTGPLGGVPFLVKDLVQLVKGEPYRAGSRFFGDYRPDHDTELVTRFRRAGLVLFGKTNTPEFGLTPYTEPERFGPSRNPWNLGRTTGGSSGGSAAAVGARIVPIAGGGDGGGSIRIPASCCGAFGLKPSRGRNPTGPDVGQLWHGAVVDHVITRSVRDSAAVLDATAGADPGAPYACPAQERPYLDEVTRAPGKLRIAFTTKSFVGKASHPDCAGAVIRTAALLESLGHEVVEAAPVFDGAAFANAFVTMVCSECASDIHEAGLILGKRPTRTEFEAATWAIRLLGKALSAEDLAIALRIVGQVGRKVGAFFERHDVLLTPTQAVPPFPIGALQPKPGERAALEIVGRIGSGRLLKLAGLLHQMADQIFETIPFTPLFNATGQPAMSVPLEWNAEGLPIGLHFVTRLGDEATLFRLAGQLEQARPWADRIPPLGEHPHG